MRAPTEDSEASESNPLLLMASADRCWRCDDDAPEAGVSKAVFPPPLLLLLLLRLP